MREKFQEILFKYIDEHHKPYKDGKQSIMNKIGKAVNNDKIYHCMQEAYKLGKAEATSQRDEIIEIMSKSFVEIKKHGDNDSKITSIKMLQIYNEFKNK